MRQVYRISFKHYLNDNLLLAYTGKQHTSGNVLKGHKDKYEQDKGFAVKNLDDTKAIALEIRDALIDEDADIRLLRRINRDLIERGRSLEMVTEQYLTFVRPMHQQFVEPYKKDADVVMHNGEGFEALIGRLKKAFMTS